MINFSKCLVIVRRFSSALDIFNTALSLSDFKFSSIIISRRLDASLILNIDFDQTTTDDLIDKTNLFDITYNQDFQIKLDEN